jgi:hypothetical protein
LAWNVGKVAGPQHRAKVGSGALDRYVELLNESPSIPEVLALDVTAAQACLDQIMSEIVEIGVRSTADVPTIMTARHYDD